MYYQIGYKQNKQLDCYKKQQELFNIIILIIIFGAIILTGYGYQLDLINNAI